MVVPERLNPAQIGKNVISYMVDDDRLDQAPHSIADFQGNVRIMMPPITSGIGDDERTLVYLLFDFVPYVASTVFTIGLEGLHSQVIERGLNSMLPVMVRGRQIGRCNEYFLPHADSGNQIELVAPITAVPPSAIPASD